MPGAGQGEVLTHLAGLTRVQRDRAADGAEPAVLVVVAEDQELWAGEAAGDGTDDRFGGVAS
ncbi:hypothetical protein GCM10010302_42090 [Streptomyces polychromogenes]|uniref:Uncharacterized protein n=1 Tax=Streptomyces polychromogenes TaxID=67342 RepID=A0ABN0VGH6_9ACTN